MKLTKQLILETIRDILAEDDVGEPIFDLGFLGGGEETETLVSQGEVMTVLGGLIGSLSEIAENIDESGDVGELIGEINELLHEAGIALDHLEAGSGS